MLLLNPDDLKNITDQAEAAFPYEACGLLVGFQRVGGDVEVTRVAASKNMVAALHQDRFEIDPEMRLRVMRELCHAAPATLPGAKRAIVGHYHSHPNGAPIPSATDLSMAWEPELIWLITAVVSGQAVQSMAYLLSESGTRFNDIGLGYLASD